MLYGIGILVTSREQPTAWMPWYDFLHMQVLIFLAEQSCVRIMSAADFFRKCIRQEMFGS
jgi:hypothetical protein